MERTRADSCSRPMIGLLNPSLIWRSGASHTVRGPLYPEDRACLATGDSAKCGRST